MSLTIEKTTPKTFDENVQMKYGAKAIMAFSSPEMINKNLAGSLKKFTTKTVTDSEKIRKEYEEIRNTGLAYDKEEYDEDEHH